MDRDSNPFRMGSMSYILDAQYQEVMGELPSPAPRAFDTPTSPSIRRPEREEKYIAIGIDFGTTYSGVSWAHSSTPNDIHHVAHWPYDGFRGKDEVQIPTQVDLASNDWGYLVSKDADPVRWFKLLLLETRDLKKDMKETNHPLENSREKLRKHAGYEPSAVISLVADFLQKLWEHALTEIQYELDLDLLPIKVAITVPAIWPLYAREKMEIAAEKAGITKPRRIGKTELILVEEPEAAAVSTLFDRKDYPEIEVGESFIVCDCGGGTIDITSYTVTSVNPFIVKEAVKGDGKLCGAFLIDDAFENWMKIKSDGLRFDRCDRADIRDFMNEDWEHGIKRAFTGRERSFSIRPPAKAFGVVKRTKGRSDNFQISSDVIKQFYSRTYNGIRELISQQKAEITKTLGKPPKKILLVGGLGASRYLYSMLHEQHQNVLQPAQAWSAVSRGAVIAVLKNAYNPAGASLGAESADAILSLQTMPAIASRIARASYGAIFHSPVSWVSPPVDLSKETPFVDREGVKRVNRVKWYLAKGEEVHNKDPVNHYFFYVFESPDDTTLSLGIEVTDADTPSVRPDSSIRTLCKIGCKIDIPWENMKEMRDSSGKLLKCRKATGLILSMSFGGAPKWTLTAGGKTIEQKADVQYA
ncbi:hypothetical protein QBC34DRAFT_415619 [Podospora aff. communis PSN243]|uniref:Uncharacterized protein n=1 Tax=Podospora aff. communis PSN243 TaxID=3040156 RepID=A0AAV9G7S2_9PEZI|nr:hypothetical protein QBC34DRAFT_415619 [Podospora aff. communis PSN243]